MVEKTLDDKLVLTQINPETHMSMDYNNEFSPLYSKISSDSQKILEKLPLNHKLIKSLSLKHPTQKLQLYTQRYPEDKYYEPVNDLNRERVEKFDKTITKINNLLENLVEDVSLYRKLYDEAYFIINNNYHHNW